MKLQSRLCGFSKHSNACKFFCWDGATNAEKPHEALLRFSVSPPLDVYDGLNTLCFPSGAPNKEEGEKKEKPCSKNGKRVFIPYSAWTRNTDWLDELHFLFPTASRAAGHGLSWLQKQKHKKQNSTKPTDGNEAISYWFTRIISPISHIVTGCTRHRPAAPSRPTTRLERRNGSRRTGRLPSPKQDCAKEPRVTSQNLQISGGECWGPRAKVQNKTEQKPRRKEEAEGRRERVGTLSQEVATLPLTCISKPSLPTSKYMVRENHAGALVKQSKPNAPKTKVFRYPFSPLSGKKKKKRRKKGKKARPQAKGKKSGKTI